MRVLVNGIWRESNPKVFINGAWRKPFEKLAMINGVWRGDPNRKVELTVENIIGFKMIYSLNRYRKYSLFPDMKFNEKIRTIVDITGRMPIEFDTKEKSLIFQFSKENYDLEGLYVYDGLMYICLENGSVIPVISLVNNPLIQLDDIEITIDGYTKYESYGPKPTIGWNSLLSSEDNLPNNISSNKNIIEFNSYTILPSASRSESYISISMIGIARNMSDEDHNMIGVRGILDHTIKSIYVNGEEKPFIIELYD